MCEFVGKLREGVGCGAERGKVVVWAGLRGMLRKQLPDPQNLAQTPPFISFCFFLYSLLWQRETKNKQQKTKNKQQTTNKKPI